MPLASPAIRLLASGFRFASTPAAASWHDLARTLRGYNAKALRGDLLAGLTVAVLEIPQAMAYALIAGVPPQYGIYTSIIQGLFGALLTSNSHLASGPTNTHSLLIAAAVTQIAQPGDAALYLQLVFGLCLIKGLIQLLFAAARMGNLVRYVSSSVIVGFTAGAGVLIALGQLPAFLGIDAGQQETQLPGAHLPGALAVLERLLPNLGDTSPYAVGLGLLSLAIVLVAQRISKLIPGPLLCVVVPAVLVWLMGWDDGRVAIVGDLPASLPGFAVPWLSMQQAEALLSGALALAILGMIETVSIGKSMSAQTGHRINADQEFFTQGLANVVGSFLQNIPGSGSFTRSSLNRLAGGQTRLAGVFNAGFVALIFVLAGSQARYIPLASLAAMLFVVAYGLIQRDVITRILRANRTDAFVCVITFVAALTLPLAYAIYAGIFLNLALYLRRVSQLHMAEIVRSPDGPFQERPVTDRQGQRQVVLLSLEGDLFFGLADDLQDKLAQVVQQGPRVVILRLKRTHSIDATVLEVLDRFVILMHSQNRHVLLCGLRPELLMRIERFGLVADLGRENVFEAGYGVFASVKRALQRARVLVASSIDTDQFGDLDDSEDWSYSI